MFTHLSTHSALHLCFLFCGQHTGKYMRPKGVCTISTDFCLRFKHWDFIPGGQNREREEEGRWVECQKFQYALALDCFVERHTLKCTYIFLQGMINYMFKTWNPISIFYFFFWQNMHGKISQTSYFCISTSTDFSTWRAVVQPPFGGWSCLLPPWFLICTDTI